MLGNSMHSLVDSVSSSLDQQVPMDALNCVRLSLECWPRISDIVGKLKQMYESGVSIPVVQPSPQVFHLSDTCFFMSDFSAELVSRGLAWAFSLDISVLQFHVCTSNCGSGPQALWYSHCYKKSYIFCSPSCMLTWRSLYHIWLIACLDLKGSSQTSGILNRTRARAIAASGRPRPRFRIKSWLTNLSGIFFVLRRRIPLQTHSWMTVGVVFTCISLF